MKTVFVLVRALILTGCLISTANGADPAWAPARIELHDQFGSPQTLTFPTTNFTALVIADRHGSEQVNQWITAIKQKGAGRVQIRGLAQVGGVPKVFQARLCREFQEKRRYPVMMDWSGRICDQFGFRAGVVNVLIIDPPGRIAARFYGEATESAVSAALRVLGVPGYGLGAEPIPNQATSAKAEARNERR